MGSDEDAGRVIVTGGTGLVGRALAASLTLDGYEVVVLSRYPDRHRPDPRAPVQVRGWDGRTAQGWGDLASGARAIVNLAGASIAGGRWTAERKALIRQSRIDATRAVVSAVQAAARPPQTVVQASAVGYYGRRGAEAIAEEAPPGDDFLARLVVDHETEAARVTAFGARLAVARTGVVLAREGGALPRLLLPFRWFVGGPVGSGRQFVSWIHIADEVAALRFLLEDPRAEGPFNLTAPEPVTNAAFARAAGRALRRPALIPAPAPVLRLLLGEMATVVLDGQRVVPRRLTSLGFRFRFAEIDAAVRALLSRPRT